MADQREPWPMHHHPPGVCQTSGCFTFVLRRDDRYCLACQLDRKMPQPPLPSEIRVRSARPEREWHKHNDRA